jgi:hypothetical protein
MADFKQYLDGQGKHLGVDMSVQVWAAGRRWTGLGRCCCCGDSCPSCGLVGVLGVRCLLLLAADWALPTAACLVHIAIAAHALHHPQLSCAPLHSPPTAIG